MAFDASQKSEALFAASNLTRSQFLIWIGQKMSPDAPLYNMALSYRISGPLNIDAFRAAFQAVVDNNDAMRTVVEEVDGVPMQRSLPQMQYDIEVLDFRDKTDPAAAAESWAQYRCQIGFALNETLFDCKLLRIADDQILWYMNQHHLVVDAWSATLIFKRVSEIYTSILAGSPQSAPNLPAFQSFVEYESELRNSRAYNRSTKYWRDKSATPLDSTAFYGQPLSRDSTRSERIFIELGDSRSRKLRQIARQDDNRMITADLTLFNIFAALLFTWQYRVTRQKNLSIGTFAHNRSNDKFKSTIGMFIEMFPLYAAIDKSETFSSLMRKLGQDILGFLSHARVGTGNASLEHPNGVILNFINASFSDFAGLAMKSRWLHPGHGDRGHALRLQVHDFDNDGSFQLHFDFNQAVFSADSRRFAVEHFLQIVDAFIDDRDIRLDAIDLLGSENRRYVLSEFNQPATPTPSGDTVVRMFAAQVEKFADRSAIELGRDGLSYRALDEESTKLALRIAQTGFGRGQVAAIVCERSIDLVVAIMAVLKTAGAYLPIDPSHPRDRIAMLLDDTDASVVLTQSSLESRLPENCNSIAVDLFRGDDGEIAGHSMPMEPQPGDPAYIIFTSGSTGRPKGVVIEHRALANYLRWARKQYVGDACYNMPLFSTISADLTVTSIFLPLICGGTVVVYPERADAVDLSIIDVFEDDRVDIVKLTPSHLSLLRQKNLDSCRLKSIIVGGEDFRTELARAILDGFSREIDIYNEYGPTEATVGCMIHRFDVTTDISASVPIGKPVDNMQIYLLDENLEPVAFGFTGELYIAGSALAAGYLGRPELTDEKFVDNPFAPGGKMYRTGDLARWTGNGILDYLGREDEQVKIKGYRIELGEIEAALNEHPQVADSVVNVIGRASGEEALVRHCLICGLESVHPDAKIDARGICAICKDFKTQKSDARAYFKSRDDLVELVEDIKANRSGEQDCVMLLSGGKDSTYVLYQLVAMGLTPLVFSLDNGYISEQAKDNVNNVASSLGLEVVWGTTPAMNEVFVDSLKRFSNVCNGCHKVIYTLSVNLALERGIRYIVTGLSRGQFFETRISPFFKNNIIASSQIDGSIIEARKAYHRMDDAVSRCMDVSAFQQDDVFDRLQFIDFYRYTDVDLETMLDFLENETAWVRPRDTGRSTNCLINEAGIYVHKKERSFHNYSLPYSWDVRLGHKQRDAALQELDDDIDEANVQRILNEIGYRIPQQPAAEKRLAAYYAAEREIPAADLREFLLRHLPAYMLPSHFMRLDSIPLSTAGKKDRNALPEPGQEASVADTAYLAPRNETEALFASIWESVMGIDRVGINDNFFDLGGDSISNIQIIARLNQKSYSLSSEQLFAHPTVAELAAISTPREAAAAGEPPETSESAAVESAASDSHELRYALSPLQQGILFHCVSEPKSGIYVEQYHCILQGELDVGRFRGAWDSVIARHGALRTSILWQREETPVQVETIDPAVSWELQDWRSSPPAQQGNRLDDWLVADSRKGFDLSRAPLTRFALMQLDENAWQFVWTFHHIILDGWSSQLVLKEVYDTYLAIGRGAPLHQAPVPSFRRYIEALQAPDRQRAMEYWQQALGGFHEPTFPRDYDATARNTPSYAKFNVDLPRRLDGALQQFAREQRLTVNTLLVGAWAITLGHYASSKDIVFGATVSGRQIALEGIDEMTGLFINTLPVRADLGGSKPVCDWLREFQQRQLEVREFESTPLVDIQKSSDVARGNSLFETLYVFENHSLLAQVDPDLPFESLSVSYRDQSNYALTILVVQEPELKLEFLYDKGRFTSGFVQRMASSLETVLRAIVDFPETALEALPVLTETDFRQYLVEINRTEADLGGDITLLHLIESKAERRPDAPALTVGDETMSYASLNRKSNQLAHELLNRGLGAGDHVGLHLQRSTDMVVAMLGVLKTGAAYVPLDPSYPSEWRDFVIEDAAIDLVLSQGHFDSRPPRAAYAAIELDQSWNDIAQNSDSNPGSTINIDDPVYVMYTSGSTGKPKGVVVTHRNLANSVRAREAYYRPAQRFLLLSSIAFDSSVAGVYWTLSQGGCLHIPEQERFKEADYLVQLIRRHEITHLLCIPSLWRQLLDWEGLSSLDTVIVAGEACPADLPARHREKLPGASLYNEYGPTEATVWSTVFDCSEAFKSQSVPIGRPIANTKVFVLNDRLQPAPIGVPGELYIGGAGVAHGYLNLPDETADRFIAAPAHLPVDGRLYKTGDRVRMLSDGNLEFLGRLDQQIKLRGFRIELGEIETLLAQHPDVKESVVIVKTQDDDYRGHDDALSADSLEARLLRLEDAEASALLDEVEAMLTDAPAPPAGQQEAGKFTGENIDTPDFRVELIFKHDGFISPPRETQRKWMLYQQLAEIRADLENLNRLSATLVPGKSTHLDALEVPADSWSKNQIMEDWQIPLMKAMARHVTEKPGDVLEIGFGRGVSAEMIQQGGVNSHTIIEANAECIETYYHPWRERHASRDIRLVSGMWQDVLDELDTYDAVFFHTFPMNEEEFIRYVMDSVTFAEHFFGVAASLLRPGGVFTYLTTEVDSFSRRHQRALFEHFTSITLRVEPLQVPADTGDTWWANSMVVVRAIK